MTKRIKHITLRGNLNSLREGGKIQNPPADIYLEPEEKIVFSDLVFTLKKSPGEYLHPLVVFNDRELQVVGNHQFFRAKKEAGTREISFDLLMDRPIELERLMEQYGLNFHQIPPLTGYRTRFLFFNIPPQGIFYNNKLIAPYPKNDSKEYKDIHCFSYTLSFKNGLNPALRNENKFISELVRKNGLLRSMEGLIQDDVRAWRDLFNSI